VNWPPPAGEWSEDPEEKAQRVETDIRTFGPEDKCMIVCMLLMHPFLFFSMQKEERKEEKSNKSQNERSRYSLSALGRDERGGGGQMG
jgi:hypothetical protein